MCTYLLRVCYLLTLTLLGITHAIRIRNFVHEIYCSFAHVVYVVVFFLLLFNSRITVKCKVKFVDIHKTCRMYVGMYMYGQLLNIYLQSV